MRPSAEVSRVRPSKEGGCQGSTPWDSAAEDSILGDSAGDSASGGSSIGSPWERVLAALATYLVRCCFGCEGLRHEAFCQGFSRATVEGGRLPGHHSGGFGHGRFDPGRFSRRFRFWRLEHRVTVGERGARGAWERAAWRACLRCTPLKARCRGKESGWEYHGDQRLSCNQERSKAAVERGSERAR